MSARRLVSGMLALRPDAAQVRITERNASISTLLRLPPEIRNLIYRSIFAGSRCDYSYDIEGRVIVRPRVMLAILFVCRQSYAEAALLPFSLLSFNFYVDFEDISLVLYSMLPVQRASVSVLEVCIRDIWGVPLEVLTGLKAIRLRFQISRQMNWWDSANTHIEMKTGGTHIVVEQGKVSRIAYRV